MHKNKRLYAVVAVFLSILVSSATAANLHWDGTPGTADGLSNGGGGTWGTSATNWDTGSAYTAWSSSNDIAIFGTANGSVTLGEDIDLQGIVFGHTGGANDNGSWEYTIQGNALNFGLGGTIRNLNGLLGKSQTISSGITGGPDVYSITSSDNDESTYKGLTFAPTNGAQQALGTVTLAAGYSGLSGGGDKCCLVLGGTSTGNTISNIVQISNVNYVNITDACDWTLLGTSAVGLIVMTSGDFKIEGKLQMTSWARRLSLGGGTLHLNHAGALENTSTCRLETGPNGYIDNTSGAAITNSTYNPWQQWGFGLTFLGSQGTNSDLNIGAGAVLLNKNARVTISHAETTFTVGGIISGANYGIVKYGAGTLRLTGANTYSGETLVYDGTLSLGGNNAVTGSSSLSILNGGKVNLESGFIVSVTNLYLDGELQEKGIWGGTNSVAANKNDTYFSGQGVLNVLTGSDDYDLLLRDDFEAGLGLWTADGASLFTHASGVNYSTTTNSAAEIPNTKTITITDPLPLAKKRYTSLQVSYNIKWDGGADTRWKCYTRYAGDGVTFTNVGVTSNFEGRVTHLLSSGTYSFTDAAKIQIRALPNPTWPIPYIDDVMIIGLPAYAPLGTVVIMR